MLVERDSRLVNGDPTLGEPRLYVTWGSSRDRLPLAIDCSYGVRYSWSWLETPSTIRAVRTENGDQLRRRAKNCHGWLFLFDLLQSGRVHQIARSYEENSHIYKLEKQSNNKILFKLMNDYSNLLFSRQVCELRPFLNSNSS